MANQINQTNTTVPLNIYNMLKLVKEEHNCTFDEVLNKLCDLELQNNYIEHVQEYELHYEEYMFPFRVTFKKEGMNIEYLTRFNKRSSKISEWGVPDNVRKEFYTFIKEEYSACLLENMPVGLFFKEFMIMKRGYL